MGFFFHFLLLEEKSELIGLVSLLLLHLHTLQNFGLFATSFVVIQFLARCDSFFRSQLLQETSAGKDAPPAARRRRRRESGGRGRRRV